MSGAELKSVSVRWYDEETARFKEQIFRMQQNEYLVLDVHNAMWHIAEHGKEEFE